MVLAVSASGERPRFSPRRALLEIVEGLRVDAMIESTRQWAASLDVLGMGEEEVLAILPAAIKMQRANREHAELARRQRRRTGDCAQPSP
jgi:hypothetical protein